MSVPRTDQKNLFTVRTYAADLEANRPKKGAPAIVEKKAPTKPETSHAQPAASTTKPVSPAITKQLSGVKTSTQESRTSSTSEIPPFHSFQKPGPRKAPVVKVTEDTSTFDSASLKAAAGKQTASTLTAPSHDVLVGDAAKDAQTATIITDTKHKRFSFTQSLKDSVSSWMEDKKDTLTGKKKPKYSVPQADRRKGVIQKATSMTGRASTADHAQVLERLRSNKKNGTTPAPKPTIEKTPIVPSWENDTTKVTPTKEIPPVQNTTVVSDTKKDELKQAVTTPHPLPSIPIPAITTPTVPATPAEVETPVVVPAVVEAMKVVAVPPVPVEVIPPRTPSVVIVPTIPAYQAPKVAPPIETVPEPASIPGVSAPVPEATTPAPAKIITPSIPKTIPRKANLETWFADTNRIVLGGGVMMVSIVLLWAVTTVVIPGLFATSSSELVSAPPLFAASIQKTFPVSDISRDGILTTLSLITTDTEPLVEGELVAATSSVSFTASDIFTRLQIEVPIGFVAAISRVTVGSYRQEPWIAFSVVDQATALGGMLAWEATLSSDLAPWFGNALERAEFKDDTINGIDVRILRDNNGAVRIIYGFIQPNVLLIVTSENTFLNLIPSDTRN